MVPPEGGSIDDHALPATHLLFVGKPVVLRDDVLEEGEQRDCCLRAQEQFGNELEDTRELAEHGHLDVDDVRLGELGGFLTRRSGAEEND
eukprot:11011956-Heterocapsa_arctica.AAC.1